MTRTLIGGLRRNAMNGITVLAVVIAAAVGTMAAKKLKSPSTVVTTRTVANWEELIATGTRLGPAGATVRIVEFGDYQCPSCARAAVQLDSVLAGAQDMAVSYIHLPLTAIHPAAFDAAIAAECAAVQGRFAEMHRTLFQEARQMSSPEWTGWAKAAGVSDVAAFEACLSDEAVGERVRAHAALAATISVAGTPAFIVDGKLYPLGTAVEEILRSVR